MTHSRAAQTGRGASDTIALEVLSPADHAAGGGHVGGGGGSLRESRDDEAAPAEDQGEDEDDDADASRPTGFRLVAITVGLVFSIFLAALDSTIVATAIPSVTAELGSVRHMAWYGSAYAVANTAFQAAWGKAYQHFALRPVFLLAVAVFEAGNVVSAAAPSSAVLILGRVVAGLGGGGVMTGAFVIIAVTARPRYRPAYMGVLGVTFGAASVVGPLLGGVLTDGPGWRWCFWINLPIGAVAALTMILFFRSPPAPGAPKSFRSKLAHTDPAGALLLTGALSCFVMAMHWAGTLPWDSAPVVGVLAGFAGLLAAFVLNERLMGPRAMLQLRLCRRRPVLLNTVFAFFLAGVYFPLLFLLPVEFQSLDDDSAARSGVRLIPLVLGISVATMLTNGLLTVWRHYHALLVLGALAATAGVALLYTAVGDTAATSRAAWTGFELLTAAGVGAALQVPMIANQDAVATRADLAAATSLSLFGENLGTVLFVAASEGLFTGTLVARLARHAPALDPDFVVDAGVTRLREVFVQPAELAAVLRAYLDGCRASHTVGLACGVACAVVSLVGAWPAGTKALRSRLRTRYVA